MTGSLGRQKQRWVSRDGTAGKGSGLQPAVCLSPHLDVSEMPRAVLLVLSAGLAHHHFLRRPENRIVQAPVVTTKISKTRGKINDVNGKARKNRTPYAPKAMFESEPVGRKRISVQTGTGNRVLLAIHGCKS